MIYLKINEDIYPDPGGAVGAAAILISEQWRCGGRAGGKWGQAWLWHCENSNTQTPVQINTCIHICKCIKNTKDGKLEPDIVNTHTNTYRQTHVLYTSFQIQAKTQKIRRNEDGHGQYWPWHATILSALTLNFIHCCHATTVSENVPLQTLC